MTKKFLLKNSFLRFFFTYLKMQEKSVGLIDKILSLIN